MFALKSLKFGILTNLAITLGTGILAFVVNRYFSKTMGIDNFGLIGLFTQLIAYLGLVEMGLGTASSFALYRPISENNHEKINVVLSSIGSIYKKIAIAVFVFGLLLNPVIPFLINKTILPSGLHIFWSLYVINAALTYLFSTNIIFLLANQELTLVRLVQGGSKFISQGLQILVIVKYQSMLGFIGLIIFDNLLQFLFFSLYCKKKYKFVRKVKERDKTIGKDLAKLFWHKMGTLIVFHTDYVVISKFISLSMVGIYSNYILIFNMVAILFNIATNALSPRIGYYIAKNGKDKIFLLWKKLNVLFLFLGTISTFIVFKTISPFLVLWLGKDFLLSNATTALLCANLFIQLTRIITDIFKQNSGYFGDVQIPILEGGINLILSILLVQIWGVNGVVIGTLISNIVVICALKPVLVFKNCFDKNVKAYGLVLLRYSFLIATSISWSILFSELINGYLRFETWFDLITSALKIGLPTGILSGIVFLFDQDFRKAVLEIQRKVLNLKSGQSDFI